MYAPGCKDNQGRKRMSMKKSITVVLIGYALLCHTAYSQIQSLDIIGQTHGGGGYTVTWDRSGERLIVGCGTSVWVYDMGDPHQPVKIGKRPLLGIINEIIPDEDVLFVAATRDGLYVLDCTSPDLDIIDHYSMKDMQGTAAYGMHRYKDTIYVADFSGVRIFTFDPATGLSDIGTFGPPRAFGVHRRNGYIAVCAQQNPLLSTGKVQIYSVDDLQTPIAEWGSPLINWVQAVQFADLRDDIIYVCGGPENPLFTSSSFFALRFDGKNLSAVDTFRITNGVPGIAQQNIINMDSRNDTLFLATTAAWDIEHLPFCHVVVLDATGLPDNKMTAIGKVSPGLWHFDVALMHGTPYAAISSEWIGVSINDVSRLAFMDTITIIPTGGWVKKSRVKDNMLWVCNEGYGHVVYDIDSLQFRNGFWCDAVTMHIHDLGDHFFSSDVEFLNDSLLLLNPSRVYNIAPRQRGGRPVLEYDMRKSLAGFSNIYTNAGQRLVATSTNLLSTHLVVFDPFDTDNDFAEYFVDTTNNDYTGFAVSGDTLYYGKKLGNNQWRLVAARVSGHAVSVLDSIQLSMPWGLLSYADVRGISVENGKIAVCYGKQIALFQWNGNNLQELFCDYEFSRNAKDIVLRNDKVYVADQFYGLKVYDVSSGTEAVLIAQTRGTGGWMNVFGSVAVTLDDNNNIYLSDFSAGVLLIEALDDNVLSSELPQAPLPGPRYEYTVYPNPSSGYFVVEFRNDVPAGDSRIVIYDLSGSEMSRADVQNRYAVFQNVHWPKGIYIIQYLHDGTPVGGTKMLLR